MADSYEPADDGPEAELYRRQAREDAERQQAARRLLWSLHPGDSRKHLFTWAQISQWRLKRR